MVRRKVFIFGDTHFPFHSNHGLKLAFDRMVKFKPDVVIQMGDLYDMFSFTRFARGQNMMTPKEEIANARCTAEDFWRRVQDMAPKAKCVQLTGNHDIRPLLRAIDKSPELEVFVGNSLKKLLEFDDVRTIHDPRQGIQIDDTFYIHGFKGFGRHLNDIKLLNVVAGHLHRGATTYVNFDGKILCEMNVGFLGDRFHKALSYTALKRFSNWTLGCAEVDQAGHRFIPFDEPDSKRALSLSVL